MNENQISWHDPGGLGDELQLLTAELQLVLSYLECQGVMLSVVTVNDMEIQELNRQWRDKDKPTDVLSFPQILSPDELIPGSVLGDIVVSVDTAKRQADERGHSMFEEMRILLIHGICHLFGHTHGEQDDAQMMSRLENKLLRVMSGADDSSPVGLVERARGSVDV